MVRHEALGRTSLPHVAMTPGDYTRQQLEESIRTVAASNPAVVSPETEAKGQGAERPEFRVIRQRHPGPPVRVHGRAMTKCAAPGMAIASEP